MQVVACPRLRPLPSQCGGLVFVAQWCGDPLLFPLEVALDLLHRT